jgi:hypothetical protein
MGYVHYTKLGQSAEANGLLSLTIFLLLVYSLWLFLVIGFHVSEYKEWREHNQDIRLTSVFAYANQSLTMSSTKVQSSGSSKVKQFC